MMQSGRKVLAILLLAVSVACVAPPAAADEYEADRSGHPVRVLAYLFHPVGVALDYLLVRPLHWLGHQEPFSTLFGHEDDD